MNKKTLKLEFYFDAAHHMCGLEKEARLLYSHTWKVLVVFETSKRLNEYKVIVNTLELKNRIEPIIGKLNHSIILWNKDPLAKDILVLAKKYNVENSITIIPFNPTIEGCVEYIFNEINKKIKLKEIKLKKVEVILPCEKESSEFIN